MAHRGGDGRFWLLLTLRLLLALRLLPERAGRSCAASPERGR
jgi:hypothetical protein